MKSLNSFMTESLEAINEATLDSAKAAEMTREFVDLLGESNIKDAVEDAIDKTNHILDVFNKNAITEYVTGPMLYRILEKNLASGRDIGGFSFRPGRADKGEKNLECVQIGKPLPETYNDILDDVAQARNYGMVLKCTQGPRPMGNKSDDIDVMDEATLKQKQSFYLIITNINWGKGTTNLGIRSYHAYVAFLQAGPIRPDVWKSEQVIQIM